MWKVQELNEVWNWRDMKLEALSKSRKSKKKEKREKNA